MKVNHSLNTIIFIAQNPIILIAILLINMLKVTNFLIVFNNKLITSSIPQNTQRISNFTHQGIEAKFD
jgi:hypothetical protein